MYIQYFTQLWPSPQSSQGSQILDQSWSDWLEMGQIRDIFRSNFSTAKTYRNLIWKSPGSVPFGEIWATLVLKMSRSHYNVVLLVKKIVPTLSMLQVICWSAANSNRRVLSQFTIFIQLNKLKETNRKYCSH